MRRSTPVLLSLAALAFTLVTPTQATPAPADDVKLVTKKLLDGRLTMKVPAEFEPMDKKMLEFKYPRLPRPQAVFTDDAAATNIAFSHTKNRVTMAQLAGVDDPVAAGRIERGRGIHGRLVVVDEGPTIVVRVVIIVGELAHLEATVGDLVVGEGSQPGTPAAHEQHETGEDGRGCSVHEGLVVHGHALLTSPARRCPPARTCHATIAHRAARWSPPAGPRPAPGSAARR